MDVFFDKPGFAKGWYDPKHKVIMQSYENFSTDINEYKQFLDACFQAMLKYQATRWLTDTKRPTTSIPLDAQEWVNTVHAPRCVQNGLKYLATVVPESALAKISTRNWQSGVQKLGALTMNNFASIEDAIKWLSETR